MRRALACSLLVAAWLGAAPAGAATVSLTTSSYRDPGGKGFPPMLVVTQRLMLAGSPGEASRLVVSVRADGAFEVREAGAPALTPGAGCSAAGPVVTCPAGVADLHALDARLGDGDGRSGRRRAAGRGRRRRAEPP